MSLIPLFVAKRAVTAGRTSAFLVQNRAMAGYWNRDWRPADEVPKTEEERRAAAKKYGLILEDYKTYEADGTGYGDYPNLPLVSAESRDPHALYDIPELKRNFGEPMPVDADMIGEDRWDISRRLRWPITTMLAAYVGCMSVLAILFFIGQEVRFYPVKMMNRQMLTDNKKHYSFELEDK